MLVAAESRLREYLARRPLSPALAGRGARPVRLYTVHEDATLLSLPWIGRDDHDGARGVARQELDLLSTRQNLPAFAPEDFFFRSSSDAYSGIYLDLGGRGLVSTVTLPYAAVNGTRAVLALDLAFDVDWRALAASLEAPIAGAAVDLPAGESATWATFATSLPATAPAPLRVAMDAASLRPRASGASEIGAPLRHALVDGGAIAAFHVSDRTWLLAWFPQTAPAFPFAAVALQSVLLALLLTGFEINRRRAHRERRGAERALQEKQNLLNTMQVPLVVVDPNDDGIVSANRAAEAIGFRAGRRFADLVWPDARARAHYDHMQVASPEPRRAYGVPVAAINEKGVVERRYAVVRSVAVTAPIEALNADERHRLGVLILLDESDDLALMIEDRDRSAHRDERRRLSGLLSHGLDTLARVLAWGQSRVGVGSEQGQSRVGAGSEQGQTPDQRFLAWLAEYLERRVGVTAWLLDHWDATTPLPRQSVIDAAQTRATIDRLRDVLAMAAADRDLRQRLHWDNGTLSAPAPRVLDVTVDWPDDVVVTCPVHGGFGLFLSELVANAVKHGAPGTVPSLAITCDRVRSELVCEIANEIRAGSSDVSRADAYGGVAILRAMARLFEWPNLRFDSDVSGGVTRFSATWLIPVSRRGNEAD
ncbi:MAG TPA: hypothetical protein VFO19_23050, partial [Vicinamibacterales bacterium]|nr:hypothetical protein [Vicinamibacterales bacterium]